MNYLKFKQTPLTNFKMIPQFLECTYTFLYYVLEFNSLFYDSQGGYITKEKKAPQESLRNTALLAELRRERLNEPLSHQAMLEHIL